MSFSSETKNEICAVEITRPCCNKALLAAALSFGFRAGSGGALFSTENPSVARLVKLSIDNIFKLNAEIRITKKGAIRLYNLCFSKNEQQKIADILKFDIGITGNIKGRINGGIVIRDCCKRAAIKGAFLSGGSITDPKKSYHLEFSCISSTLINDLASIFEELDTVVKQTKRKTQHVIYFKDNEQIADILSLMGARNAFFAFHEIKIEKEIRNSINRQLNCENANMDKTISASVEQIKLIETIVGTHKFETLPDSLKQLATLRLEHKEASFKELGEMLNPPVSKSCVNHRFRKLAELIDFK